MLGLLKQDEQQPSSIRTSRARSPASRSLPELIDNVRDAGLTVDYQVTGEPRDLPALLGLTAYRIVQEGLTNTLKHAGPGARTSVQLDFGREMLTVVVTDDGRGAGVAPSSRSGSRPGRDAATRLDLRRYGERRTEGGRRLRGDRQAPVQPANWRRSVTDAPTT